VVEDGYEFFARRQLVTIFSAPNYCGEFDNAGAMMSVDDTLMCSFQILKPADKKQRYGCVYVCMYVWMDIYTHEWSRCLYTYIQTHILLYGGWVVSLVSVVVVSPFSLPFLH
jgi:hypothetical protein